MPELRRRLVLLQQIVELVLFVDEYADVDNEVKEETERRHYQQQTEGLWNNQGEVAKSVFVIICGGFTSAIGLLPTTASVR